MVLRMGRREHYSHAEQVFDKTILLLYDCLLIVNILQSCKEIL